MATLLLDTRTRVPLWEWTPPQTTSFSQRQRFIIDFGEANADFTMCDLINPSPKRTRKLLSPLEDYTSFHRMASKVFEKTSGKYGEAIEEAQEEVRLAENRKHALRSEHDTRKRKENEISCHEEISVLQREIERL
ncbi:unnamed protein product [Heligmosomoides polygyrus]|uniref:Nuf2 domain-containing protein n=1 Tax=Heligmosomoides polygyrus TaxID=6339 RepID=A0A3P7XLW5_HELPZ|nr:unnamed protein product [Heligmosomoides polygyrus]